MLQPVQKEIWNEKVQEFGLHTCLHDKSHPNQFALQALWETKDSLEPPLQSTSAYDFLLQDYITRLQVVGAEDRNDQYQNSGVFNPQQRPQFMVSIRGFPDHDIIRYLGR